jgi:DNA-binding Xre family transcriptional regulator
MTRSIGHDAILAGVRAEFRRQRLRIPALAASLGISEPTLRRWLKGDGLTLDALDRVCDALNIDIRDLLAATPADRGDRFTLAQERVLAADRGLSLLFFSLLHGADRTVWERDFGMQPARIDEHLERLHRLDLIDLRGDRIRPRMEPDVRWQPGGPLSIAFHRTIAPIFLAMDFGAPDARYLSDMMLLSPSARARVHTLLEDTRADIRLIEAQDRRAGTDGADWSALLFLVRPLPLSDLRHELR